MDSVSVVTGDLPAILWGIAALIGFGLWLLLARSRLVRGGEMERTERVPQLYGYSVCLIAIVVGLVSLGTIVNKSFTLANPLRSVGNEYGWSGSASLTSFEAYQATYDRGVTIPVPPVGGEAKRPEPLSNEQLRARYDVLRADQISRARFDAMRELTGSAILLLVSAGLFVGHWRWVKGAEVRAVAARAAVRDLPA
jgi:hypothetical protein